MIASTYNAAGELTQITDPDSTYSYTYDLDGRMLSVSNEGTPNLPTTIMSYSYDNVGNVLSMIDTINGSLGIATTREYDALNRLTTNAQGYKQVIYAYNAISQVITKYRYSVNNLVAETNHIYDNLNRLTNITHSNGTGANTIASYSQTYDQGDRITGVTSNDGSSSYTYDDTNQLVSGEYDFQDNESYSYDSNGNRTNNGYVTGVNNQLLEDNKYLYEYDIVGNRTKRTDKSTNEVMEYRWDIRDRLTGITVKNDLGEIIRTAEYTYDVYNQRIAKTVDADGDSSLAAATERFVYGRDQNIALVFDENGNVNHRYLFGNGVDQIEADESNGNVLWALTDHLGSVRDIVDDSGTVLNHIVYDAFGGVTSQTDESVVFRYGYTARELDAESGLQYNRARYLDSFTGKFISEDPIGFGGGDSNLYRYVGNSAANATDPFGLWTIVYIFSATSGNSSSGGVGDINPFGHTAIAINGTYYNFNREGLDRTNSEQFYSNYSLVGVPIRRYQLSFSKGEEDKIATYLNKLYSEGKKVIVKGVEQRARPLRSRDYDLFSNNCTTLVIEALRETRVGEYIRRIIEPFDLEIKLRDWADGTLNGWRDYDGISPIVPPPVKTTRWPDYIRQK